MKIIAQEEDYITIQIATKNNEVTFLETEEEIMKKVNEVGRILTKDALEKMDENEERLERNKEEFVLKKRVKKVYETPYGSTTIERNIYHSKISGKSHCPMEDNAKTVRTATPKLAKSITSKYTRTAAGEVKEDLKENHDLSLSQSYIQNLVYSVGKISESIEIEYILPKEEYEIATVGIGLDGTCSYVGDSGWRETMVGTLSLYKEAEQEIKLWFHPDEIVEEIYPVKEEMIREIGIIKRVVPPSTKFVGIADGAKDNWSFLAPFVEDEILDFYHASEYLAKASKVVNLRNTQEQKEWFESACHSLKNDEGSALTLLETMKVLITKQRIPKKVKDDCKAAITYFNNHHHQMNYAKAINNNIPIGSGVTESACKILVKQRLCLSGAKWSHTGASHMLKLRAISLTDGRWKQLWDTMAS